MSWFEDWYNGKASINPVRLMWDALPGNVKDTYTSGFKSLVDMSTPAAVRDYTNSAQDTARSALEGDGWGTATNALATVNNALAAVPIAGLGVTLARKGAQEVGQAVGKEAGNFIRAYHGSPHSFDKFDLSKIGTGEGAQAYGHGLYFAENEGIARNYRDNLAGSGYRINGQEYSPYTTRTTATVGNYAADALNRFKGDTKAAIDWLRGGGPTSEEAAKLLAKKGTTIEPWNGSMYEVAIHADPAKFLDWDKPLAEQSPFVSQAIESILRGKPGAEDMIWRAHPGGNEINLSAMTPDERRITEQTLKKGGFGNIMPRWQHELQSAGPMTIAGRWSGEAQRWGDKPDPIAASAALKNAGVPGVRYLDGGSRAAGDGSRNYVVFDDSIIEILRKYGLLPAAGAGAVGYGAMQQPQEQPPGGLF